MGTEVIRRHDLLGRPLVASSRFSRFQSWASARLRRTSVRVRTDQRFRNSSLQALSDVVTRTYPVRGVRSRRGLTQGGRILEACFSYYLGAVGTIAEEKQLMRARDIVFHK